MIFEYKPFFQFKTSEQRYQYALLRIYQQYRPRHCFIAKLLKQSSQAKVLCHLHNGNLADNFIYALEQTPCEQVSNSEHLCLIERQVQNSYPDDKHLKKWQAQAYLGAPLLSHTQNVQGILVCIFDHEVESANQNLQRFKEISYILGGELNHQIEVNAQNNLLERLANGEKISKTGTLKWDSELQQFDISEQIRAIFKLAYQQNALTLEQLLTHIDKKDSEELRNQIKRLIDGSTNHIECNCATIAIKQGKISTSRHIQVKGIFEFDKDNHSSTIQINIQDVTDSYKLNQQLNLSNFVFEHTSEAIMITDSNNKIVTANSSLEHITGYQLSELIGKDPKVFSSGRHDEHFYRQMWNSLKETGHWKGEVFNQRKDGHIFPEELSLSIVHDNEGKISNYVAIFRDITERKATEQQLRFFANNEPLTGLANRRSFIDSIEHHISIAKRHDAPFSILYFDVDRFKEINDIHGHNTGDKLLQSIAKRLLKCIRSEDIVCRYGGDEFTILLVNTNMDKAGIVAEKIQNALKETFTLNDIRLDITSSIGIVQFPDSGDDATTLLRNANHAMVSIKSQGRNGIAFHNSELQNQYLTKLNLRNKLKRAISNKQIEVHYQPIIDIKQGAITKFESLVRWHDGDKYISPGVFIPIAEEFGFIHHIGNLVLEQACKDLKRLHDLGYGHVTFSINRSISEFRNEVNEAQEICQTIEKHGLTNSAIVIEITESVAMSSNQHTEQVLSELKANGVRIALDDFCTGYSSLSNLIEYKSDFLKIDKSFIDAINEQKGHQILIQTLIDLASKLDMSVVAEGVEHQAQLDLLQEFGCQYIQGFYFSPARPIDKCIEMLKEPLKSTD